MSSWINGNLTGNLSIGQGERGKSLEYEWRGTALGIRLEGEEEYQFVDLKGEDTGGANREIELQKGEEYIQWKYKDEEEWKNLIAINDLKGQIVSEADMIDYIGKQHESLKETNDANMEYILREVNVAKYEGYSIVSSNTYQKQITDAKLKGVSKFIDITTNQLIDEYEDSKNLDLIGSSNISIVTCNAPRLFGKGGRL